MGLVWNPVGALLMGLGAAAFLIAIAIYFSPPWSSRNRWLALAFVAESWTFWIGVAWSVDDFESAYAAKQVWTALFVTIAPLYLLFASTLESPLARPLRARATRIFLVAWAIALPLLVVLFPGLSMRGWSTNHWYAVLYALPAPALRAYTPVMGAAFFLVLAVSISAWRRAPPGSASRRDMSLILAAFAFRDAYSGASLVTYPFLRWRLDDLYAVGFIPIVAVTYGLLAYGMLRHQLFDVRLRARRLGRREGLEREREEVYRIALEGLSRADDPDRAEGLLASLRRTLGISAAQHAAIASSVAREDLRHRVERRGRFRIVRELGRGGQGRALLARDLDLERDVVLKEPLRFAPDGRGRDRLLAEARAVARISHPNVVAVHA
ncbi:MAG TPA: hypothetical protein VI997_12600, partial [Candidatus Thermoplasmatota archaeon]|nr:hypothetical protein [Candidatus Thermoplasmatota archaeon]